MKPIIIASAVLVAVLGNPATVAAKHSSPKYAGIVIDAKSGKVLYARNADSYRYPASLTKMMTLYIVFEEMKARRLSLKSRIRMTRYAASQPPSKLGIKPGRTLSLQQAILSLVTKSANDVATAVGETISGSEAKFARRMTNTARRLGMSRTTFRNANGLPNRAQRTTARDMAKLGLALREHFPRQFRYFKTRSFKYGRKNYPNHNRLLGRIKGVDGIKTGYTRASGFNLVSSVGTGNRRIVAVVMGGKTGRKRNAQMTALIKRYLPKATRGKTRLLVARANPPRIKAKRAPAAQKKTTQIALAQLTKPTTRPITQSKQKLTGKLKFRPVIGRVEAAFAASASTLLAYNAIELKERLSKIGAPKIPFPIKKPDTVDPIVTAGIATKPKSPIKQKRPTGWQIQIGATPSLKAADTLLNKARKRNGKLLASASKYTETVQKGSATLYRARFTGFSSKSSARRACKILKKRKFACLALQG